MRALARTLPPPGKANRDVKVEPDFGFEPKFEAYKAPVLPLN